MAVPSYTTDLTTIATGDLNVDAGTWDESTDSGWDTAGAMVDDQNLYYNNSECVSAQYTKDGNGSGTTGPGTIFYNHTAAFTIPADGAALIHHMWAAPPALNTIDNVTSAGINICAGSSLGDFYAWKASGSNFAPSPRGGWANYAINPAIGNPDHTVGTAPVTYSMIGVAVSALAQARGNPQACNAVRYGRCTSIYEHGEVGDYATFNGYADVDAVITNKWNLFDIIKGGYEHQGLMSLGTATNPVDFRDSSKSISIANTINVTTAFNRIEVHNVSSNVEWTAIDVAALGTVSKGTFEAIDNAVITKVACKFTDLGTFKYLSNSTLTNTIRRRCEQVTQGGATITGETFDAPNVATLVGALVSDDLELVTNCNFTKAAAGHAIELISLGDGTLNWNNNTSGYDTGAAASPVTPTSTGDEDIWVNVGSGTVTISVAAGATIPSIRSAGATVNVVSGQVTLAVAVQDKATKLPINLAQTSIHLLNSPFTELMNKDTDVSGNATEQYSFVSEVDVVVKVRKSEIADNPRYFPESQIAKIDANGLSLTVAIEENDFLN